MTPDQLAQAFFVVLALVSAVVAIVKFIDARIEPLVKALNENTNDTRAIRTELFGYSGNNGIRSEVREMRSDVKGLLQRIQIIETDQDK